MGFANEAQPVACEPAAWEVGDDAAWLCRLGADEAGVLALGDTFFDVDALAAVGDWHAGEGSPVVRSLSTTSGTVTVIASVCYR